MSERAPGRENLRQIVHLGVGVIALSLRFLPLLPALLLTGALFLHNSLVLPRYGKILWRRDEVERGFAPGIVIYPAVLFVLVLVFRDRLHLAAGAWAILAFGDGAATLAGRNLGGPRLPWNRTKSCAGSVAYFVIGTLAAAGIISFVSQGGAAGAALGFGAALVPAALAALLAAGVESLPLKLDDNISGPAAAAVALWAYSAVRPDALSQGSELLLSRLPWALGITAVLTIGALRLRVVDRSGAVTGFILAAVTWVFAGRGAFVLLAAFVGVGTLATWFGRREKTTRGVAQENAGRRSASHALANTGVGAGLAFLAVATGKPDPHLLALAGALAAATGDTVASEVGPVFSDRPRLVTNLRVVTAGTPGAVSGPGTIAGALAVIAVACLGAALGLYGFSLAWIVIVSGVLAMGIESLAGALLEPKGLLDHHTLNLLNTACGAAFCYGLAPRIGG